MLYRDCYEEIGILARIIVFAVSSDYTKNNE